MGGRVEALKLRYKIVARAFKDESEWFNAVRGHTIVCVAIADFEPPLFDDGLGDRGHAVAVDLHSLQCKCGGREGNFLGPFRRFAAADFAFECGVCCVQIRRYCALHIARQ